MSAKTEVDREAKRLANLLMDEPRRGDRVFVTVLRCNPDELSVVIGVDTVLGSQPPSSLDDDEWGDLTPITHKAPAKRKPKKRKAPLQKRSGKSSKK